MNDLNVALLLDAAAVRFPDRDAIVHGENRISYRDVDAAANRVANLLTSVGVGCGDTVALSCPNIPGFPIVYFGILKTGAAVVPLNTQLKAREYSYHLTDSDAKAFFCFGGAESMDSGAEGRRGFEDVSTCEHFFEMSADTMTMGASGAVGALSVALARQDDQFSTVNTDADDTAVIMYTSGTTGRPKGAELRHRNMYDNALAGDALFGADSLRPDTFLAVLPLFHAFGQTFMQNLVFAYGGTMVLLPRFDAGAALEIMNAEAVTVFAGVPTMYWALLSRLDECECSTIDLQHLRVAIAGGAALPVELHREFERRLGISVIEGYGLSETSPVASFSVWGEPARPGSIGVPIRGVEMKLVDAEWRDLPDSPGVIGEIAIKGHNVMKGYRGRPEATSEVLRDGWFRTGDLARKDDDGWYYIVDRSKDLIIRAGYNVYPREIEEVLMSHPEVSLAAVVGIPHPTYGEEVKAFVILKSGVTANSDDLIAWVKGEVANYKYPRLLEFVSEMPMTATGKILKRQLASPDHAS